MLARVRDAFDLLPALRGDPALWSRCAYREILDPEFGKQDANSLERYRFLIALQYEVRPDDERLVRYLFDQEVLARSKDDHQGFGEPLRLASYLLSRWKRRGDFWRFAEAKFANFDTYCGFDSEYLLAVRPDVALAEFETAEHELKEPTRKLLFDEEGECRFASEEIDDWEKALVSSYSRRPDDEPPIVWIERAIVLGAHEEGRAALDQYVESGADLSPISLAYLKKALGDMAGAVDARRQALDQADDDWRQVSNACSLSELLVEDGRPDEAWSTLELCDERLARIPGWTEVGLGRSVVEVAFRIAKSGSSDTARAAFAWACDRESQLKDSTLRILTIAAEAASALEDAATAERYETAARAERRRIDEMLNS